MPRAIPPAVLAGSLLWIAYIWWGHAGDAQPLVWIGSGVAIGAALAGVVIPARFARAHAAVAGVLVLTLAGFVALRAAGRWPFAWDSLADARYAAVLCVLATAVGLGLLAGAFWARWGALALAASASLGGILNSIHMARYRDESAWLAAIGVIGAAVILAQLGRAEVGAYFARNTAHAVWARRDRLIATARWAAIANFAAATMLVLYALGQPVAPATVWPALALAPVLALGALLVVLRRGIGIALLALGGLGLLAQTAATFGLVARVEDTRTAGYYAAFWLPAALLGLAAAAIAFARARR